MNKHPKTFVVKGITYTVVPYDVEYGLTLLEDLLVLFGEPLAQMIARMAPAMKEGGSVQDFLSKELDVSPEQVSAVMQPLMMKLGGGKMNALFRRILEGVIAEGSTPLSQSYTTRFMGDYGSLFLVVAKTLGAQYGDFLGGGGGLAAFMPKAN